MDDVGEEVVVPQPVVDVHLGGKQKSSIVKREKNLFIVHSECASIYAPLLKNSNQHRMFAVESNPKLELTIASNEAIVEIQLCLTHIFMLRMCSKLSGENFNDPLSHPPAPFQQLHHSALNSTFFWKENTHSF